MYKKPKQCKRERIFIFPINKGPWHLLKIAIGSIYHLSDFPFAYFSKEAAPGLPENDCFQPGCAATPHGTYSPNP